LVVESHFSHVADVNSVDQQKLSGYKQIMQKILSNKSLPL